MFFGTPCTKHRKNVKISVYGVLCRIKFYLISLVCEGEEGYNQAYCMLYKQMLFDITIRTLGTEPRSKIEKKVTRLKLGERGQKFNLLLKY